MAAEAGKPPRHGGREETSEMLHFPEYGHGPLYRLAHGVKPSIADIV